MDRSMTREQYKAMSSAYRKYRRNSRWVEEDRFTRYPRCPSMPPQPPQSAMGLLLLAQASRRANKLYWIGYRKRQAERDAQPRVASSIPDIPGWVRG